MNDFITQFDAGMAYTGDVQASGTAYPEEWLFDALSGGAWGRTETGETVNPRTAKGHGPVWAAINILAGDVGQLPIHVSRKKGREVERYDEHPVEWLLAHEPNQFQTPSTYKETMIGWYAAWGNCCAWVVRDGSGRPSMLVPLLPDRTTPLDVDGEWWIETDFGDGKRLPLPYEDVFHLPWFPDESYGGFWGIGPIQACKNVIAGGMAIRKHGNKTFANGAKPGGGLEIPGPQPTAEQMREKRAQLEAMHGGAENAGKWLLLYNGTKFFQQSSNNHDAQWLESLDLDREFIALIFGLPPYKLGSMKNSSTRANTEQQQTDYLNNSLSRHLNKFREEVRRKLFSYGERRLMRIDVDWTYEAFLRADLQARGAYYAQAKTGEWMTSNEIRQLEGLNPIKGGDELKNPAINPSQPKAPEPQPAEQEPAKPDNENARRAARSLIQDQTAALLEGEAIAIENACGWAGKGICRNVNRFSDNYYSAYLKNAARFLRMPCELAVAAGVSVGDWEIVVSDHACDSQARFLSMTGIATKDSLPEIGHDFAESVRSRKASVANSILGG